MASSGPHRGWNPRAGDRDWVASLFLWYWPPRFVVSSCAESLPWHIKVCEGWSVSPLRPLPLLQLGVGFWCRLDVCVFSGTALNENISRGGLCWQGVDWAPWQGGSFLRALSGRVGATVGALWSLQFTLRGDTENLGWWVEVTTAFSWKAGGNIHGQHSHSPKDVYILVLKTWACDTLHGRRTMHV